MPNYDYECRQCGHTFEAFQKMSEAPLADCPGCGGKGTVKRLIGAGAGLIFKGSGFYITDYKKAGGDIKARTAKEASAAKGETAKSEPAKGEGSSKSESAPASTPSESKSIASESSSPSTCGNVTKAAD